MMNLCMFCDFRLIGKHFSNMFYMAIDSLILLQGKMLSILSYFIHSMDSMTFTIETLFVTYQKFIVTFHKVRKKNNKIKHANVLRFSFVFFFYFWIHNSFILRWKILFQHLCNRKIDSKEHTEKWNTKIWNKDFSNQFLTQ